MSGRVIKIYADQGWQDTGFALPAWEENTGWLARTEGAWCFNTNSRSIGTRDADGRIPDSGKTTDTNVQGRTEHPYHGENAQTGQLVGRWGEDGQPFIVGTHCNLENKGDGRSGGTLWLRMNDHDGGLADNDGYVTVTIATFDRTRRTQWDSAAKQWVYSDTRTPV
ncbi:hypothetical protein [Nonomuraea dietziae]|uniref:hypothetical protein n=1 Tax=Nonomuraea dietziae TaxID=65515 RepID=UPI0034471FFA